jgi:hypothetical protein
LNMSYLIMLTGIIIIEFMVRLIILPQWNIGI